MQCNQPLCGNGLPHGSYHTYTPPVPYGGAYPEIIGEGDITSVTLPDGTVQFLFTPSVKWWAPYQFNANHGNANYHAPYVNTNTGAWFIRSFTNPTPNIYNSPCQRYELPSPFHVSDCNITGINNGFQIKFHNDGCTSTTDIHYFYPNLRRFDCSTRNSKACAAVQVETPLIGHTIHHYNYVCGKPCDCSPKRCGVEENLDASKMSIESKSQDSITCFCRKESKKGMKSGRRKSKRLSKSNSTKAICESNKAPKAVVVDKLVTTYADTGSSCTPAGGQETQTCCENPVPAFDVKKVLKGSNMQTELWRSKTPTSKRLLDDVSLTKLIELSTSCSSDCSCQTDTE